MSDKLAEVLIRLFAPYEKAWAWHIRRQYRRGKFRKPYGDPRDIGKPCVRAARRTLEGPRTTVSLP